MKTTDLRVCPSCWSTVHRDELDQHDEWHERMQREAVAAALRSLGTAARSFGSLAG